eukprot:gene4926-8713_t
MAEYDLAEMWKDIRRLEAEADALHVKAQELNKQSRFEEAVHKYREYRRCDDDAIEAALRVASIMQRQNNGQLESQLGASQIQSAVSHDKASNLVNINTLPGGNCTPGANDCPYKAQFPKFPGCSYREKLRVRRRCIGAILGAVVGDAAATSVQWVYDPEKLKRLEKQQLDRHGHPGLDFMDPPANEHFEYEVGRNSPYGEQALVLLEVLAKDGCLDTFSYAQRFADHFGGDWHVRCNGYRDASCKGFLRRWALGKRPPHTGAQDKQINCITRLPAIIAAFGGTSLAELYKHVEQVTLVTQGLDEAVAWACLGSTILNYIVTHGKHPRSAVLEALNDVHTKAVLFCNYLDRSQESLADSMYLVAGHLYRVCWWSRSADVRTTIAEMGRNCHTPNSYQTPVHAVLHHLRDEIDLESPVSTHTEETKEEIKMNFIIHKCQDIFKTCIRAAMREGGCCASRCGVIGALLGGYFAGVIDDAIGPALHTSDFLAEEDTFETLLESDELVLKFIPEKWRAKTLAFDDAMKWARAILNERM